MTYGRWKRCNPHGEARDARTRLSKQDGLEWGKAEGQSGDSSATVQWQFPMVSVHLPIAVAWIQFLCSHVLDLSISFRNFGSSLRQVWVLVTFGAVWRFLRNPRSIIAAMDPKGAFSMGLDRMKGTKSRRRDLAWLKQTDLCVPRNKTRRSRKGSS